MATVIPSNGGLVPINGTLYTTAGGASENKVAIAEQIYDQGRNKFQSAINTELYNLNSSSVSSLEAKITQAKNDAISAANTNATTNLNAAIASNVTDKLGKANGIATLGADGKLTSTQLPAFKTINNFDIRGSGNIELDLTLYKVVTTLPTTQIDPDKIYLVLTNSTITGNIYTEYIYVDTKWEELGKYKANVDLTPYIKKSKIAEFGTVFNDATVRTDTSKAYIDFTENLYDESTDTVGVGTTTIELPLASGAATGIINAQNYNKLSTIPDKLYKEIGNGQSATEGVRVTTSYYTKNTMSGIYSNNTGYFTIPLVTSSANGVMSAVQNNKLAGIANNATADSAITLTELAAILT